MHASSTRSIHVMARRPLKSPVRSARYLVLALAAVAVVALAACGGSSGGGTTPSASASAGDGATSSPSTSPGAGGAKVSVSIADFAFSPAKLEISAGTTVTWTNNDTTAHDVTSTKTDDVDTATTGLFSSGTMQAGDTFSYTFDKKGDFYYECSIHATMPSMHAEIEVK